MSRAVIFVVVPLSSLIELMIIARWPGVNFALDALWAQLYNTEVGGVTFCGRGQ
jgi:hypothetical protein